MARIADKHGLTNPYREFGHKRLVKRGRKRKYILGSPSKKRKRASYKKVQKKSVQKETIQNQTVDWRSINYCENVEIAVTNSTHPRKGMRICSKLCLGWGVVCVFIFLLGSLFADGQDSMEYLFLGEGLFVLVIGLMFNALSKTEKGNPDIYGIKKYVFVIICIVIAYIFMFGSLGISGGLK